MLKNRKSKMTVSKDIRLSYDTLCDIADRGPQWDFNRQLCSKAIRTIPQDGTYPVVFALPHFHRHGLPCEAHMRIMIDLPGSAGYADVPLLYFNALPIAYVIRKGNRLLATAIPNSDETDATISFSGDEDEFREVTKMLRRHLPKAFNVAVAI